MNTNHVITQEDFDVNPLITQLGLKTGDTISYNKVEADEVAPGSEGESTGEGEATGGEATGSEAGAGEGEATA